MPEISESVIRDPDLEWLDHVPPTGLVLSPIVIKERTLVPERQTQADTAQSLSCSARTTARLSQIRGHSSQLCWAGTRVVSPVRPVARACRRS